MNLSDKGFGIKEILGMPLAVRTLRDADLSSADLAQLRLAVGWDAAPGHYDDLLPRVYARFSAHVEARVVGFVYVLSDGKVDAFLLDLMVHPDFQGRGIGEALVKHAVDALTADGIRCIQVTFNPGLEAFYERCGFHIFRGGIIDHGPPDFLPA